MLRIKLLSSLTAGNEGKALLKLIEGGRSGLSPIGQRDRACDPVTNEGKRRLREHGLDRYIMRERLTGVPIPPIVKSFQVQIEFAISALSQLTPVPSDITDDGYWPSYGGEPLR